MTQPGLDTSDRGLAPPPLPKENIYGHLARVEWFKQHIVRDDLTVEFGCGTGYRITYPLRTAGYNVFGVDIDATSVEYGQDVLRRAGLDPAALIAEDLADVEGPLDAVIASEVLEHLDDELLLRSLALIHEKLRPGGKLLVTVPNGYGWFELEALLWDRAGLGGIIERRAARRGPTSIGKAKQAVTGGYEADPLASTLANSPHMQRFTLRRLTRVVAEAGFDVVDRRGSVLVCGRFSDLLLTGVVPVMRANQWLGRRLTPVASGFYIAAVKR